MDTKERHVRENESNARREENLLSEGRNKKSKGILKSNRLWIWLGVLVLIFILVYWLFIFGTAEDITGVTNG